MDYIIVPSKKRGMTEYGSVFARVRTMGINRKYAIGLKVKLDEWELYRTERYVATELMESIGMTYGHFVKILELIRQEMESAYDPSTAAERIGQIRERAKASAEEKPGKLENGLCDYIEKCIVEYKTGHRLCPKTAKKVSRSTIARLTGLRYAVKLYESETGRSYLLEDIDMNFQRGFVLWNKERGMLPNSINNLMSTTRKLLRFAYEEGISKNKSFRNRDFVPHKQEVDHVYLKPDRIAMMYEMNLSSQSEIRKIIDHAEHLTAKRKAAMKKHVSAQVAWRLMVARDIFLVGCFTGQRFSDYSHINRDMFVKIKGKEFIDLTQIKTGKKVLIPLDRRVKAILDRHRGYLPKDDNKRVNENLRFLCEMLGWVELPAIDKRRMGYKFGPRFCDMVTTHTARRSFATNAYSAGVPLSSIMAITGHSREEKLRTYLKLQAEDKARMAVKDLTGVLWLR